MPPALYQDIYLMSEQKDYDDAAADEGPAKLQADTRSTGTSCSTWQRVQVRRLEAARKT
jgi:hypothetical protein